MLKVRNSLLALLGGVLLLLATERAGFAFLIDFEGLSDFETVTNQYSGSGVTFSNATAAVAPPDGTLNEIDFPPTSGITVVSNEVDTDSDGFPDDVADMLINFTGVSYLNVSGYFVYSNLNATQDFVPSNNNLLLVSAFSPTDLINPILTLSLAENLGAPELLQFSGIGPIAALLAQAGTGDYFTLDDLTFTDPFIPDGGAVVPEPATLLLVSLGGLGFVSKRFQNKQNK